MLTVMPNSDWHQARSSSNVESGYLCGALNAVTGQVSWVKGESKNSVLFVAMLHKLVADYPEARRIHIALDNFKIHDSEFSRTAVASLGGKVVLHFLPPYCPDHNKIERMWLDMHANVTRNHMCGGMNELMRQVIRCLTSRNLRRINEEQLPYLRTVIRASSAST